ncbi:hypothetical protein D5F01_LYC05656 [Larimichthys crocea]|uniref:Uncharacterized protein n=1 Tax=Larimichthys crocea TaxID=215358 RepID=A0A6G0J078_LARCR|nr:hypothetical protein D5F01_LYC05656 [Larimichthys crocea]
MPRKGRRSEAARLRWSRLNQEEPRPSSPPPQAVQTVSPQVEESRKGPIPARRSRTMDTPSPGSRSPVSNLVGWSLPARLLWGPDDARATLAAPRTWPTSPFTGWQHKLVVPPESPDKKFVLIVGDSHLRALVDGLVDMPEVCLSFGFMSTPGASASQLQTEVQHAVLPRIPEAVCLLAPSNNLTASRTVDEAAIDFAKLLTTVRNRWPKEFHRVAARMGVKYSSVAEHFPLTRLELWSRKDGVHLSDHEGMGILTQLLWSAAMYQLETPPPAPQVSPRPSQPLRKFSPKLVVVGDVLAPRSPDPFQWRTARQGSKEKECSFPLNPSGSAAQPCVLWKKSPFQLSPTLWTASPLQSPEGGFLGASQAPPDPPQQRVFSEQPGWITPSQVVLEISNAETPCSPPVAKMVICFVFNGAGGFRNASPASQGPPQQPVFSEQQLQALKVNPDLDSCPLRTPAVSGAMGGYDEPDQHVKEEKEEYGDVMLPASLPHVTSLPPPAFKGSVSKDAAEAEAVDAGEEEADEEVSTDKPLKIPTPVTGVAKLDTGLENVP